MANFPDGAQLSSQTIFIEDMNKLLSSILKCDKKILPKSVLMWNTEKLIGFIEIGVAIWTDPFNKQSDVLYVAKPYRLDYS